MSFRTLELPGMRVTSIDLQPQQARVVFEAADIIKTMSGARQRSRWQQSGEIILSNPRLQNVLEWAELTGDHIVTGGQITDNVYVYQDMIRLPLHSSGNIELVLQFEGVDQPLSAAGDEIHVTLYDNPQYLGHFDE